MQNELFFFLLIQKIRTKLLPMCNSFLNLSSKKGPYQAIRSFLICNLSVQIFGLTLHVLDHDVVNLSKRSAVFQHLPRSVGVKMQLHDLFIADHDQAVSFKMLCDVIVECILIHLTSFNQKLGVKFKFQHRFPPAVIPLLCG